MTTKRSSFPFLRLPGNIIKHVVRSMEPLHSLNLSLCSKVTKSHVRSSGLKCSKFIMLYEDPFRIEIQFDNIRTLILTSKSNPLNLPPNCHVLRTSGSGMEYDYFDTSYYGASKPNRNHYRWENKEYESGDWIQHLLFVLNRRHVDIMHFEEEKCCIRAIRASSKGLQVNSFVMQSGTSAEYSHRILWLLKVFNKLFPNNLDLEDYLLEFLPGVYIQNFNNLCLSPNFKVTLDDMLMMNTVSLVIRNPRLTMKDLNRFIKLWMANGTNRRLKYLKLTFFSPMLPDHRDSLIMKSIDHRKNLEPGRNFELDLWSGNTKRKIKGGFCVHRKDGTEATIIMKNERMTTVFKMYVWN
ncbi:unnamed protein product [Caenorhabditis brenneri]